MSESKKQPFLERLLQRWKLWMIPIVVLAIIFAVLPRYRQYQALVWVTEKGGYYETKPSWISSRISNARRIWLDDKLRGTQWSWALDDVSRVYLKRARIEKHDLWKLSYFSNVEWLDLDRTVISDRELAYLKTHSTLEWLDLDETRVTDAGLVHLRKLSNLSGLCLSKTEITDAGLVHFYALTSLKQLYLNGTEVSAEGVKKLRKVLPGCEIYW